jgi:hypothetical protein
VVTELVAPVSEATDRLATRAAWLRWAVPALAVFAGSLVLYLTTIMPGLGFWDTAEFQTLGPVLGIAHPTGYPSYTLLLWLASVVLQPFGDPAFRANLLSALLTSGAGALCAVAVVQVTNRWLLGLAAGALLAVSPIAWVNAVRAGPNAFHLFLAALLLVLLLAWGLRERRGGERAGRWLIAASLVFGVSLGNHGLTILLAPGVAAYVLLVSPRILWRQWRLVLGCFALLVATTVLVYAYIPLRASMDPPLNYAIPTTWERLRYLVFGEQFRSTFHALPSIDDATRTIWGQLWDNLGIAAVVALAGFVVGVFRRPRVIVLTGLWFALTWAFALAYETADIERYYLVPLLAATVWAALALDGLWDGIVSLWSRAGWPAPGSAAARAAAGGLVAVLLLVPVLLPASARRDEVDASGDTAATRWLDTTLAALPENALVASWWSYSTPLWYGRWVEGRRPDVTIIDDRNVLDEGYGTVERVIDRFLGERPVYVIRLEQDLDQLRERYTLEHVAGSHDGALWRVVAGDASGRE